MKIIALLLLLTSPVFGQEILNKADKIEIASTLTDDELYKIAGRVLVEQGYTINKSERDFYQIQTEPKDIKGSNANPRLQVGVGKGRISIIGWLGRDLNVYSQVQTNQIRIANRGMKGSPLRLTFDEMDKYAKALAKQVDGTIQYKIAN